MVSQSVFINCPFDVGYEPLFNAIVFTILACGYVPRCALEEDDATNLRLNKILELIGQCEKSIHDLSRIELGETGLPRFNMPFELGLMMGAKYFGGKKNQRKSDLVLTKTRYSLPTYMSDMGGNDPAHHDGKPELVVDLARRYLGERPRGGPLPGKQHIIDAFASFREWLPKAAREAKLGDEEINVIGHYRTYGYFVTQYLKNQPVL